MRSRLLSRVDVADDARVGDRENRTIERAFDDPDRVAPDDFFAERPSRERIPTVVDLDDRGVEDGVARNEFPQLRQDVGRRRTIALAFRRIDCFLFAHDNDVAFFVSGMEQGSDHGFAVVRGNNQQRFFHEYLLRD